MLRKSRPNAVRSLIIAIILVLIGWLIARTWLACSAVIVSESMAPALLGPHLSVACPACGQTTPVAISKEALSNLKAGRFAACGNCGELVSIQPDMHIRPGEKLLVKRNLELAKPLQRWDLIACQDPESPEKIIVKRIVGLPGETVQIIDGDVFINGQIVTKSLDQQAATAVSVYNADHESIPASPALPQRWVPASKDSNWLAQKGSFYHPGGSADGLADRLVYHHQNRVGGKIVPGPITDQLAYNQWLPIRRDSFRPISDLMLAFHMRQVKGKVLLKVFIADDYVVTFDYAKENVFVKSNQHQSDTDTVELAPFASAHCKLPHFESVPVLISTVDCQLMIVVDREVVIRKPLPKPISYGLTSFALEPQGQLDISRLRIYRDVYYVRPPGIKARWGFEKPVQLGKDEYFILGDNSRVSEDSRTWPKGPAIHRREIFGRP